MRTDEARTVAGRALAELLPADEEAAVRLTLSTAIARPATERIRDNRAALALRGVAPRVLAEHRGWLAYNLMENGDVGEAERHARAALGQAAEARAQDVTALARLVLAAVHCARGDGAAAAAELDRVPAPEAGQSDVYAPIRDLYAANLLHCLGRPAEAVAALTACLRHARRDHNLPLVILATELSAMINTTSGRLAEARAELESPTLSATADGPVTLATVLHMITSAALAQHLGDAPLARAATASARRLRTSDSMHARLWAGRVLATAALKQGNAMAAAELLAGDPLLPAGPPLAADTGHLIQATWVADAAGDCSLSERAVAAVARLEAGAAGAPAFAAGAEQIRGLVAGDPERLLSAATAQTAAGRAMLAAVATEDAGGTLLRRRRDGDAVVHLNAAFDMYAAAGAVGDAQRVRSSLRAQGTTRRVTGDRPGDGWGSLTVSELRVVRLIAAGATNRNAAQQLFISPHTVSTHVRNVFAKLGITSRVQLANALRDNGG